MAQCMIFEEDEVSVENESGLQYALVIESSEFVSSDEEDEDNSYWDRVKRGTLRVAWHPDGEEEIVPECEVKLADRSLMPGDVVRRLISGQDSQRGYVRNTVMYSYLQILGKPKVICDVDTRDLQFLEFWDTEPGDVYLGSWVGKILKVSQLITLKFSDGARIEVEEEDFYTELSSFEDIHEKRDKDSEFAMTGFYPGQRLKGYLTDLQKVKWLVSTKHHSSEAAKKAGDKEVLVTVEKVVPKVIDVHWLCQGFAKGGSPSRKAGAPSSGVGKDDIKRLRKLDCFEATSVQLGDKVFYVLKDSDVLHNVPHKGNKTLVHHVKHKLLRQHSASEVDKHNAKNALSKATEDGGKGELAEAMDTEVTTEMGNDLSITEESHDLQSQESHDLQNQQSHDSEPEEGHVPESHDIQNLESHDSIQEESHDSVQQEEDLDEYISDVESNHSDGSGTSTQSAQSADSGPRKKKPLHKKGGALPTKILKKKKLKKSRRKEDVALWEYKPGDRVACEVIYTESKVEVMWQDGTVEKDIPSNELYPIHHLDELEFFPGDYVVPSSNTETSPLEYGVVSRVDHAGRTCMVTWFKSNEKGLTVTPVQSTVEEASVYDIKDHMDYKFRPGRVVVRVGGYETERNMVAAGQVYELGTDGRLLIRWADESQSYCYPQEVYLIGDDLSELNSDLDSDLESSDMNSSGEESWETEEEEDVSDAEGSQDEEKVSGVTKVKRLSESAGRLFDVVITSLQKLEELFSLPVLVFCQMKCFKEVLKLYKSCREVDRKLNASYFDDSKLRKIISMIKSEMRKEQQKVFSEKVQELIEKNMQLRQGGGSDNKGEVEASDNKGKQETSNNSEQKGMSDNSEDTKAADREDSNINNAETQDVNSRTTGKIDNSVTKNTEISSEHLQNREFAQGSTGDSTANDQSTDQNNTADEEGNGQSGGNKVSSDLLAEGRDVSENSSDGNKAANMESLAKLLQNLPESLGEGISAPELRAQLSQLLSKDLNVLNIESIMLMKTVLPAVKLADHIDQSTQTSGQPDCGKCTALSQELCQQACHLLREIVIKIQEELGEGLRGEGACQGEEKPDVLKEGEQKGEEKEGNRHIAGGTVNLQKIEGIGSISLTSNGSVKSQQGAGESLHLDLPSPIDCQESTETPMTPQTPAEIREKLQFNEHGFSMLESVHKSHRYKPRSHQPTDMKTFTSSYRKELKLLHSSLPHGIFVKGFEDRMDLFSVMIHGPEKTPYEDGMFFFDVQLPEDFPNSPPNVHYIAFCTDRLNPNLYEDGTVCVSLLGTWQGKGTEVWTKDSSLLQILISVQGLILVSEPYYNEAGYEKQKGSQQGLENSRMYNEMALLKMVQSVMKIAVNPPEVFKTEVRAHLKQTAHSMLTRVEHWLDHSPQVGGSAITESTSPQHQSESTVCKMQDSDPSKTSSQSTRHSLPDFPLLPVSKGFTLTTRKTLIQLRKLYQTLGILEN